LRLPFRHIGARPRSLTIYTRVENEFSSANHRRLNFNFQIL
jgi:hypothetical protein